MIVSKFGMMLTLLLRRPTYPMSWTRFVGQVCGLDKLVSDFGFQAASWIWGSA